MCGDKCKILRGAILCLMLLEGAGCQQLSPRNTLAAVKARGELRVLTREDGISYYKTPYGPAGFEYELAKAFADHLGVKLKVSVTGNFRDMVPALLRGRADIIAAGFAVTKQFTTQVAFGPPYMEVTPEVVGRRGGPSPQAVSELMGHSIWVKAGTPYEELLREQKATYPKLSWFSVSGYKTEDLLEMVAKGIIPSTVADSTIVASSQRYYPQIVPEFPLAESTQLAWAMDPLCRQLQAAVCSWFERPETAAFLQRLKQRYFGRLEFLDYVDLVTYQRRLQERLPDYRWYFKAAGKRYGVDWRLVAALAYQESQWDPEAESLRGVKGIMMLTRKTTEDLGVTSRLDPAEAIFAGARYFAHLHKCIGSEVSEPGRTYMALAAYNLGLGHLEDARLLAKRLGRNPDLWQDVRSTLPLLHKKRYYRTLPHGYARGTEAVRYVDRIRAYYRILVQATDDAQRGPESVAGQELMGELRSVTAI
jgi:membrane-bound lytic murein transglycosylase F